MIMAMASEKGAMTSLCVGARVVYVRGIDIRGHHIFEQGKLFGVVICSIVAFQLSRNTQAQSQ